MIGALLLAIACNGGSEPAGEAAPGRDPAALVAAANEQLALRRKAHLEALDRSIPEAERAFALADPVAAFLLGRGALTPAPHTIAGLAAARRARRSAFDEIAELDVDLLDPAPQVQLRAIAFGLERLEEAAAGRSPTRTDPTVGITESQRVLDVIDRERAHGRREGLAAALASIGPALRADLDDLGASSVETLDAALDDLVALRDRVQRLGTIDASLSTEAGSLAVEIDALRERLQQQRQALPTASEQPWSRWPTPARGEPVLTRLPSVLGASALTHRLEVEEGLDRPFVEAVPQLLQLAERLDAIDRTLTRPTEPADATPVDAARCEAAVLRVRAAVEGEAPPELACSWLLTRWGERSLSDAALTLAVIDDGLVQPQALQQQRAAPAWIALQSGTTAPRAHGLAKSLAIATRIGQPETTALAVDRTREALCATVTAVWIHGELPSPERLDEWLRRDCPTAAPQEWIARAIARPRATLDGLALTLVGASPAGATMLELVPWAPLGLVPPIAKPRRPVPADDAPLVMQPLGPDLQPLPADGGR